METLKNQCYIQNVRLDDKSLNVHFRIRLEGKVCELWDGYAGRIKVHASVYGDDGHKGDERLFSYEYPLKISYLNQPVLEEDAFFPMRGNRELLNEDKKGKDEIYVLFYLTMTLETTDGVEVDAMISEVFRTEKVVSEFKK